MVASGNSAGESGHSQPRADGAQRPNQIDLYTRNTDKRTLEDVYSVGELASAKMQLSHVKVNVLFLRELLWFFIVPSRELWSSEVSYRDLISLRVETW